MRDEVARARAAEGELVIWPGVAIETTLWFVYPAARADEPAISALRRARARRLEPATTCTVRASKPPRRDAVRRPPALLCLRELLGRPAATDRLVQVHQRHLTFTQCQNALPFGFQQVALRIQYVDVADVAAAVAQFGQREGLREQRRAVHSAL